MIKVILQKVMALTNLSEVTHGLACRVPLTKLVELDGDTCLYLTTLMVATLGWVGEALVVLEGMQIMIMAKKAFNKMLLKESSNNHDNYWLVSR